MRRTVNVIIDAGRYGKSYFLPVIYKSHQIY